MHPPYTYEDLTALAAGELGTTKTQGLRRHFAQCPACRAEWDAVQSLWTQAQAAQAVAPPTWLPFRVADALPPAAFPPRRRLGAWKPLTAGGAVVGTAFVATLLLTPGSPVRPLSVFAAVEKTIQQARIVTYTSTLTTFNRETSQTNGQNTDEVWLRQSPPAYASVPVPGRSMPPGNVEEKTLLDDRGQTSYSAPGKSARRYPPYSIDTAKGYVMTPRKMQAAFAAVLNPGGKSRVSDFVVTSLTSGLGNLAGRPVFKFVRKYWYRNLPENTECIQTAYVAPKTLHLIRIETKSFGQITKRPYSAQLDTDFRYDATPPAGTFDWSPPKGSSVCVTIRTSEGRYLKSKIIPSWPDNSYGK